MKLLLVLVALGIPLWLNVKATLAVKRDSFSKRLQKIVQLLFVWLVPLVGALLVLSVHRPKEKHNGHYPDKDDFLDPHLPPRAFDELGETTDSD